MSDMVRAWLDHTQQLDQAATPGPWEVLEYANHIKAGEGAPVANPEDSYVTWCEECQGFVLGDADAEWIAHTRTAHPQATAALRAVLDLHRRATDFHEPDDFCAECSSLHQTVRWPCPTVTAIQAALCDHTSRGTTWTEQGTTAYACDTCGHEWTEEP